MGLDDRENLPAPASDEGRIIYFPRKFALVNFVDGGSSLCKSRSLFFFFFSFKFTRDRRCKLFELALPRCFVEFELFNVKHTRARVEYFLVTDIIDQSFSQLGN